MLTVHLPALESWQRPVYDMWEQNPNGKIFIIKSIRQVGKSALAQVILIAASMKKPKSISYLIEPVLSQARRMYEDIVKLAGQLVQKANGGTFEITFINGSKIVFKSEEQGDSIRGGTIKGSGVLIVDEAAFIDSDFFYSVLLPMTNVNKSNVFIFSTPKAKQGFFYELFMNGLDRSNGKCISFDWTTYDTSKYLDKETLEVYRKQLPASSFKSEFLGQWLDSVSSVFGDWQHVIKDPAHPENKQYYIGIDWSGQGQHDYTAISIFNKHAEMVDLYYFNDKDETETINFIVNIAKKYAPIKIAVETNSIGKIYYGLLDKALVKAQVKSRLIGFMTTNDSKDKIMSKLQVAIQNNQVSLLNDPELIKEINGYEMAFSKNGHRIYGNNAKSAEHDDIVMATAIAFDSLQSGDYSISIV